ncbi:MAG: YncE family protein [Hyalangium sp.]
MDGSPNGALYVASANFDKCYDTGSLIALDLDSLGLPEIGASVPASGPAEITDLQVDSNNSYVQIDSFAGEMTLWTPRTGGTPRLFVPTRAEGNYLHAIDIQDRTNEGKTILNCVGASQGDRNCVPTALSLTSKIAGAVDDQPRAPAPIGVTVDDSGDQPELWVTHTEAADSPARSSKSFQTYLVHLPDAGGDSLSLSKDDFVSLTPPGLPIGGAHATAIGDRYVYVTGRNFVAGQTLVSASFLLRLVDRTDTTRILETSLSSVYQTLEARDIIRIPLGKPEEHLDKDRLYILARSPDTLLVVDVDNASSARPSFLVVSAVPLPEGASGLQILRRGDPGDELVAVTCAGTTRTLGVLVLYDTKLGQVVRQVGDVGTQPYGLAVDQRGTSAARVFVTNFGDGRVAVIDIPNIRQPQDARLVAYLGEPQGLDPKQGTSTCRQETQP